VFVETLSTERQQQKNTALHRNKEWKKKKYCYHRVEAEEDRIALFQNAEKRQMLIIDSITQPI